MQSTSGPLSLRSLCPTGLITRSLACAFWVFGRVFEGLMLVLRETDFAYLERRRLFIVKASVCRPMFIPIAITSERAVYGLKRG